MHIRALVAFGVVLGFGLSGLPVPGGCSEPETRAAVRPAEPATNTIEKKPAELNATAPGLSLAQALERALEQSPTLAAFSREVRARDFEAQQAGLHPNPEVSVEMENLAGTGQYSGTDGAETTLRISQRLELGGKRAKRRAVGQLETEMAKRTYQIVRADVLSETTARFISVLAARKRLSLAEEQVRITQKILDAVAERIRTGKTAAVEKVRFQTLSAEASLRREKALHDIAAARLALAASWGSREVDFGTVRGHLEKPGAMPNWADLDLRLDQSPVIGLQQAESQKSDRILALERARRIPDLTVSLGVKDDRDAGDEALVAGISIPLPIFDRNQGAVAAARIRKEKAVEEARASRLRLRAELAGAWQQLQSASSELDLLHSEIIPASQKTFDAVAYGYQAGKFGFLEVLDAEQTLFEAKNRYIDALTAYHQAVSVVERLLGQNLTDFLRENRS